MRTACCLALLLTCVPALADETLVLRGRVHTGDGTVLEDGLVTVRGGKLVSVEAVTGPVEAPEGARLIAVPGGELTPGLIDAAAQAVSTPDWVYSEQGQEVVPQLRVLDALDFNSHEWDRLPRRGVTTIYVTGDGTSVISGRGVTVKTAGPERQRVLQAAGAIRATLSMETWTRGTSNHRPSAWRGVGYPTRRPTTRMGLVWVFREAFTQARRGELAGPAGDVLRQVLAGEIPLRIEARHIKDLETAFRLTRELGLKHFVLEEATEAYRILDQLKAAQVPVIFGPLFEEPRGFRARTGEADRPCLSTPLKLHEAGIPFALTAMDRILNPQDSLPAQATMAIRYGLPLEAALTAVTSTPAALLGLSERIGTLAPGKDADLVVWSGVPFAATSRPLLVLIDGVPVLDEVPAAATDSASGKKRY